MIPVTRLRRAARRRLRPRRLGPRHGAGAARPAAPCRWSLGRRRRPRAPRPRREGLEAVDLRTRRLDGLRRAGAVARRAADPSRAALDASTLARGRRRRDHRRHRAVLPRAPPHRARRALRRHHRHQRQVDHDGADRPYLRARPGATSQLGGNIGTAILSLEPPAPARVHVVECSSYQIDLAPTLDPSVGVHPQRHPGPSRPARHDRGLCRRSRSGSSQRARDGGHRRRRRLHGRAMADRVAAGGPAPSCAIATTQRLADGRVRRGRHYRPARARGRRDDGRRRSPASARCAARTTPRTPAAAFAAARALGLDRCRDRRRA